MTRWLVWLLGIWLLVMLWAQLVGVGLLVALPHWVTAAERRWPRAVAWIERVQFRVALALLVVGVLLVTAVLVHMLLWLPG